MLEAGAKNRRLAVLAQFWSDSVLTSPPRAEKNSRKKQCLETNCSKKLPLDQVQAINYKDQLETIFVFHFIV